MRKVAADQRRSESRRKWREANVQYDRSRCRERYLKKRDEDLEKKRVYYQDVLKAREKTEEGRFKDRQRKARRRAACKSGNVTLDEWRAICRRHDDRCAYCGQKPKILEMDHVVPLTKGGLHCAENVVPACKPCNSSKGNR